MRCFYRFDKCDFCGYNLPMVTVGVRDLKNQLSAYLRLVQKGEVVVVMDHSDIVAEIHKPSSEVSTDEKVARYIRTGVKNGTIVPAKRINSILKISPVKHKFKWKSLYDESREG